MTAAIESNNINWMAAKGWLKDGEASLLVELASQLGPNAAILNIGVEYGKSLACLRAGNPTATIYGIDLDISKAVSEYGCILIPEDSHRLVREWNRPLDLIFVDGDHGETGVFLDGGFAEWLPVGGYILFQDCFDYDNPAIIHQVCPGVYAGVERWRNQPHIKQEFEEWPSVDTTRVFKRVKAGAKEHEQEAGAGLADSSGVVADLREAGSASPDGRTTPAEPELLRPGKNTHRRR